MSEEADNTLGNENEAGNPALDSGVERTENDQAPSNTAANILSGKSTEPASSPFDALFVEDGPKFGNEKLQAYVEAQKDGAGLEKALEGLRKVASQKGYERPAPDADEETWNAFNAHLRTLNGIPENREDYKLSEEALDGMGIDSETVSKLADWAHERGIPASTVEEFLPFNKELNEAIGESFVNEQLEKTTDLFGGPEEFGKLAEETLKPFMEQQGYNAEDMTWRNAEAWAVLRDLHNAKSELAELKGESPTINSGDSSSMSSSGEALQERLTAIQKDPAFTKPTTTNGGFNLQAEFRELVKKMSGHNK